MGPRKGDTVQKNYKDKSPDADGCAKVPDSIVNNPRLCVAHLWTQSAADQNIWEKTSKKQNLNSVYTVFTTIYVVFTLY